MSNLFSEISAYILPLLIVYILFYGIINKVNIYETFIDGAKEGLKTSVGIIPYLMAIIVAVGMFRASGAIEFLAQILKTPLSYFNIPADVLPIMIVRSLSGSANLGVLSDIVQNVGANSYTAKLAAVMVGCSETTFYVLAVYFGAVGIKKIRYALITGLLADFIGIIASICVASFFFL